MARLSNGSGPSSSGSTTTPSSWPSRLPTVAAVGRTGPDELVSGSREHLAAARQQLWSAIDRTRFWRNSSSSASGTSSTVMRQNTECRSLAMFRSSWRTTRPTCGRIASCSCLTCGRPTVVAGVPPDYFSETGQLWGNPLYDWDRHQEETGFAWWMTGLLDVQHRRRRPGRPLPRVRRLLGDSGRGRTAVNGEWRRPRTARSSTRSGPDSASCLSSPKTSAICHPRSRSSSSRGFPGMRVLTFGFVMRRVRVVSPPQLPNRLRRVHGIP